MSNILRKQNKMIDMTPPADAYDVTYGNSTVGDELDVVTAKVPAPPSANGTYKLTCVVSSGVATYSWVSA